MTAPPKRHWFRFSLRTLFVVVTIFGVWFGWQLKLVRNRKVILSELKHEMSTEFVCDVLEEVELNPRNEIVFSRGQFEHARVPLTRRLLGDETIWFLMVSESLDPSLIDRVEVAFPETVLQAGSTYSECLHWRDSLCAPAAIRKKNIGTLFKTGRIEK